MTIRFFKSIVLVEKKKFDSGQTFSSLLVLHSKSFREHKNFLASLQKVFEKFSKNGLKIFFCNEGDFTACVIPNFLKLTFLLVSTSGAPSIKKSSLGKFSKYYKFPYKLPYFLYISHFSLLGFPTPYNCPYSPTVGEFFYV